MQVVLSPDQTLLHSYEKDPDPTLLVSFADLIKKITQKHEVWIACNEAFPKSIVAIRHILKNTLASERITLFRLPFEQADTPYQEKSNTIIQHYFLSQLFPDVVMLLKSENVQKSGIACKISISRTAQKKKTDFVKSKKPTLAYFSPLPPAKSGIAAYSSELLPYLSHYYDITLVVEQTHTTDQYHQQRFPIYSVQDFKNHSQEFDRILYHFGNSFYHTYMWPLLKQYPGTVMLHDFFLSGLLSYEEIVNHKKSFWTEQLFKSHGYHALAQRFDQSELDNIKEKYPCNYEILQNALGVIVHSHYAKKLAHTWYDIHPLYQWSVIPLLRKAVTTPKREEARKILGFSSDDLVICSFGLLNATKLNHMLLQAFLQSTIATQPNCHLVFVGENNSGQYALDLEKKINASKLKNRIKITGWTDDETFQYYLHSADIAIQLRTSSRGESSATVLDCMNYGIATIVNANGSMSELPNNALYMLDDNFHIDMLVQALDTLGQNKRMREELGKKAEHFIRTYHDPSLCASQYYENIETSYQQHRNYTSLLQTFSSLKELPKDLSILDVLSDAVSDATLPHTRQRQLLVDVSVIQQNDMKTGIERVVRAQLLKIIEIAPASVRVEPVYLDPENGISYRYARNYTCNILNLPVEIKEDPVEVFTDDIFYAPDFYPQGVIKAAKAGLYTAWAAKGVKISFLIHDILPIQYPHFFPEGSSTLHHEWMQTITNVSDTLICTSKTGAQNVQTWITNYRKETGFDKNIDIETVYLGSDIEASSQTSQLSEDTKNILEQISKSFTFLMVGTIEPRKGHLQTISAFENLWENGIEANLVIVGKEGWKGLPENKRRNIPKTVKKLREHPRLGTNLFWLEGINDLFLEKLYHSSNALIVASEDEGFGLPLIEGAHYGLPLIVRDIPIFRELASDHAFYFPNTIEPEVISDTITSWLALYKKDEHPKSDDLPTISWEESAKGIISLLLNGQGKNLQQLPKQQENRFDETALPAETNTPIHLSYRAKNIYHTLSEKSQNGDIPV